jgi:DNA-binding NarL/FixJ family response regulator
MNKPFDPDPQMLVPGSRIVLVEARSLNRRLMVDWLKKAWPGCRVDAVATPAALDDGGGPVHLALFSFGHASIAAAEAAGAIAELRRRVGSAPLVVLGEREDRAVVADALALGANGYVPTSFDALAAMRAIEFVMAGGTFVPAGAFGEPGRRSTNGNGGQHDHAAEEDDDLPFLTPRERDVAARVCAGKPNKIIAHELQISEATVKVFVRHILSKLGATNRTEAASAIRRRLGDDEDQRPAGTSTVPGPATGQAVLEASGRPLGDGRRSFATGRGGAAAGDRF